MSNSSDVTSEFHTVAISVITWSQTTLCSSFLVMFIIVLHTEFHLPKSSGLLVIVL